MSWYSQKSKDLKLSTRIEYQHLRRPKGSSNYNRSINLPVGDVECSEMAMDDVSHDGNATGVTTKVA